MKPIKISHESQKDLFRVELKRIVDLEHELVKLGENWGDVG